MEKNPLLKRYISLLTEYVGIASISVKGQNDPDTNQFCLRFLQNIFSEVGVRTELWNHDELELNPIFYAHHHVGDDLPTVLVYGHYDVVPVETEGWTLTNPWEMLGQDGYLYGRGTTDNKGQNLMHIVAITELIRQNKLTCNVKFFIEGNEETGSPGIDQVIRAHKEELACDMVMASDGSMAGITPVIERSLRGIINLDVEVKTSDTDNHSGLAGGAIYNSTVEAAYLINSLFNENSEVTIPGFNDGISEELQSTGVQENNEALAEKIDFLKTFKIPILLATDSVSALNYTGLLPSLEITGIRSGGDTAKGYKNIIPGTTYFGINIRIVAGQDPDAIAEAATKYLQETALEGVTVIVTKKQQAVGTYFPVEQELLAHTKNILSEVYETPAFDKYCGGAIPVMGFMQTILGAQILLVPLANDDCNMHGDHENITLYHAEKGITFSEKFFSTPFPKH